MGHAHPTRRRDRNLPQKGWRVYYGDVHAGTIAQCVGNPGAAPRWQWRGGSIRAAGRENAPTARPRHFEEAHTAFETAWHVFLAKRTAADFEAWREQQASTAEKYRRFDRGERMSAE